MEDGTSNKIIIRFCPESANNDVKKNFIGACASNFVNRIISFHNMISESGARYPFVIVNTDRSDKKHCWSFFDLHPRKEIFMFDSFDYEGFKEFLMQNDQKIINKIFYGVEKFDKKDNKIFLVTLRFSITEYKKLKFFDKLSKTTVDLLYLINEYGQKHKLSNKIIVHFVDDQLQMIEKDMCGMYQIYFYVNLFNSPENSGILNKTNLNRRTKIY